LGGCVETLRNDPKISGRPSNADIRMLGGNQYQRNRKLAVENVTEKTHDLDIVRRCRDFIGGNTGVVLEEEKRGNPEDEIKEGWKERKQGGN